MLLMKIYTKPENYYDPTREMQPLGKEYTYSSAIIMDPNLKYVMWPGECVQF